LGIILAFCFVEDKTHESLAKEDEDWRAYLVAHGAFFPSSALSNLSDALMICLNFDPGWEGEMGDGSEGVATASQNVDNSSTFEFELKDKA